MRLTQEIDRSIQDVFATVADAGAFASWNPTIRSSRQLTPGDAGEDTICEWRLRGFGTVKQQLQEFEPPRRVRIVPMMRSLAGGHRFVFTDLDGRTRVEHELEMTPRGIFKLMTPIVTATGRRNLQATADALRRYLEER